MGAGIGGLTLARILHVHGVPVTVYDRDVSPHARPRGGCLDLHEESGQRALRQAGLHGGFRALVRPRGEDTTVCDKHATVLLRDTDGGGTRPAIDRGDLRALLLRSLPPGTVQWGAEVTAVRLLGDGVHAVEFADGGFVTTALLVGADGAWSRVRPAVSDARPAYSGLSLVEVHLTDPDGRLPGTSDLVRRGTLFALSDERGVLAHRAGDGGIHGCVAARTSPDWARAVAGAEPHAVRGQLAGLLDGWHPDLRAFVEHCDDAMVARAVHALPVGHRWARTPGVTLIGDAAHLMPPFAGEGTDLAMRDAAELALALCEQPDQPELALAAYERAMFPRAEAAATASASTLAGCFSPAAPQALVDIVAGQRDD